MENEINENDEFQQIRQSATMSAESKFYYERHKKMEALFNSITLLVDDYAKHCMTNPFITTRVKDEIKHKLAKSRRSFFADIKYFL